MNFPDGGHLYNTRSESARVPAGTDEKGNTLYANETVSWTEEVMSGYTNTRVMVVTYPKFFRIIAREPAPNGHRPPREIWSIVVTNEDEGRDLEEYIPLLVAAAMDSIDQNASAEKTVVLRPNDDRVVFVRSGL